MVHRRRLVDITETGCGVSREWPATTPSRSALGAARSAEFTCEATTAEGRTDADLIRGGAGNDTLQSGENRSRRDLVSVTRRDVILWKRVR